MKITFPQIIYYGLIAYIIWTFLKALYTIFMYSSRGIAYREKRLNAEREYVEIMVRTNSYIEFKMLCDIQGIRRKSKKWYINWKNYLIECNVPKGTKPGELLFRRYYEYVP